MTVPRRGDSSVKSCHFGRQTSTVERHCRGAALPPRQRHPRTTAEGQYYNHSTMRVAIVSDAIYPFYVGGKEKRTHKIALHLAGAGHEVHLYTMSPSASVHQPDDIETIDFHFISGGLTMYRNEKRSLLQALQFSVCVLKLIFEPFDVLDVDQVPLAPIWSSWVVCVVRRKPMIATWHEYWSPEYWKAKYGLLGLLFYKFQRLTARRPAYLVAVSEETRLNLQQVVRKSQVLRVIPNAIDTDIVQKVRPAAVESDIIFVGRLQPHKNIGLLIEAVDVIRTAKPNVRCLIVGSGPQLGLLHGHVMKLGLSGNITLLDEARTEEEIFALMKASKVFVLPSEREGFSIATLEAIACGLPVITVDQPLNNAKSLVRETRAGSVVPNDPDLLAQAVRRWLDADLSPRAAGELFAYGWSSAARATADVYMDASLGSSRLLRALSSRDPGYGAK